MKKDELYAKLDEFSERLLKLFNAWRKSVKATGNKKVLKKIELRKIDWLGGTCEGGDMFTEPIKP